MGKINWGIISTASIGIDSVLPGIQKSENGVIKGIASRDIEKANSAADKFDISKTYGSYEDILRDDDIDAVYIPLPNHLHVEYSIKALNAGKHVLCEKPIALSAEQAEKLYRESKKHPNLKCMEAFMYRHHPQWSKVRDIVDSGKIGEISSIQSEFSYWNVDEDDIRNKADLGGGGLMDIGCYCISTSRFVLQQEPERVWSTMKFDSDFQTDKLTHGVMEFESSSATFTCGTQQVDHQRMIIMGTDGKIEIEIPFNAPEEEQCRLWLTTDGDTEEILTDVVDQYAAQVEDFASSILEDTEQPYPLKDAVKNMKVIDAIFQSNDRDEWVDIE